MTQGDLLFSGSGPISRHNSYKGAVQASRTRASKTDRYYRWLCDVWSATDQSAADALNLPLQSICSIRNGLLKRGKVRAAGSRKGRYGCSVTIWEAVR